MRFLVLVVLILGGCQAERDPYSLAPACPYSWKAMGTACDPESEMVAYLAQGIPVCAPDEEGAMGLCELINIALMNNPNTRESWADARIAATSLGIGRADLYPEITGSGAWQTEREGDPFGTNQLIIQHVTQYGPEATLTYLLLDFGARRSRIQGLCEALKQANWTHNRELQTVIDTVASDYYDYLASLEQVEAGRANVEDATINFEATEARYRAGVNDISDVLTAKTQLAQQELQLLDDEEQMVNALATLANDVGISATTDIEVAHLPKKIPTEYVCSSVEDLVSRAYHCRPDLLAALANVRSQKAYLREAYKNNLGQVTFEGNLGSTWFNSGESDKYDYTAIVKAQIPIFKGWWYMNKIRKAKAEVEKARAQLRGLELSISKDVVTSYRDFAIASDKVKAGELYVTSAEGSYESALAKYKAGTTDFTTLFTAQATLADARSALVSARQDWYTSLTDLAYSVGTLCPPKRPTCTIKRCSR